MYPPTSIIINKNDYYTWYEALINLFISPQYWLKKSLSQSPKESDEWQGWRYLELFCRQ
ncbi:hypothetical protein GCM10027340_20530 [Marinomonas epiphytica]